MASGGHRDDPAPVSAVIRLMQMNPGLRAVAGMDVMVDRSYRVPYLGGISDDGTIVYVDSQTPGRLPVSGIEPDQYYAIHERVERWLMVSMGWPYDKAHRFAHGTERLRMKLDGIGDGLIEAYETESQALVSTDEHVKLSALAFPSDLFLGPYESDEDALDLRLLPLLREARQTWPRGAVSASEGDYGPGHAWGSIRRPW